MLQCSNYIDLLKIYNGWVIPAQRKKRKKERNSLKNICFMDRFATIQEKKIQWGFIIMC